MKIKKAVGELRYSKLTLRKYQKLTPDELAQRKLEFEAGTVPPILIRGNEVLDGMQRVETAKCLGITHVDAIQIRERNERK
jgi:ParB-like chromosome segregation protein Spo0J